MSDNLFQKAIENNETRDFFEGRGKYYSHNPFDGEHCYGIRLSGDVNNYLLSDEEHLSLFNHHFKVFIDSLERSSEGLTHLLPNLAEIQRLRKKGLMASVDYDENFDSEITQSVEDFFSTLSKDEKYKEQVQGYLRMLEADKSQQIASIIQRYLSKSQ